MATNVGDLVVQLSADTTQLTRELGRVTGPNGALMMVGRAAGAGALAAGAALASLAGKGIAEFQSLDTKMREVFTLLPGITQDGMDDMTAEVIAFSREFGKLPDEVVPALYQALSAGVPQDNVFEFMGTATRAAIGGVATIEEAVDVLSSVVNAYGADNISANEASDILFTTIRLGKTDMSQLAAVVSRVTPIANSLGVEFSEVGAAMAAMTATGVPTAESATMLRSLLAELSKEGAGLGRFFAGIAGQSFPEFVAGGGTVEQALQMMDEKLSESGMRVGELAGSIEAGMAATILTSENGALLFGNALEEMQNASGATDQAFEMMDEGIQASWNRLTAGFRALTLNVGEKLAPMFQRGVDFVTQTVMPELERVVLVVFDAIAAATETLTGVWERYQTDSDGVFATVRGIVEAAGKAIGTAFDLIRQVWESVLKPTWDAIAPLAEGVFGAVGEVVAAVFASVEAVMRGVISFMRGDFETAWNSFSYAVTLINNGLRDALMALWNGVRDFLAGLFAGLVTAAQDRWTEMRTTIEGIVDAIRSFLFGAWDGVLTTATEKWGAVRDAVAHVVDTMSNWIREAVENDRSYLSGVWDGIRALAGEAWAAVSAAVLDAFNGMADGLRGIFQNAVSSIADAIAGVVGAVQGAWDFVGRLFGRADEAAARAEEIAQQIADAEASVGAGGTSAGGGEGAGGGNAGARALGGVVTGPMRALIGEAGPEAVIPLDRLDRTIRSIAGTSGGSQTIIVELDGMVLTRAVAPRMVDQLRVRTGIAGA